jgi:hypothetical protein
MSAQAEAEWMASRIKEHPERGSWLVFVLGRAKFEHFRFGGVAVKPGQDFGSGQLRTTTGKRAIAIANTPGAVPGTAYSFVASNLRCWAGHAGYQSGSFLS